MLKSSRALLLGWNISYEIGCSCAQSLIQIDLRVETNVPLGKDVRDEHCEISKSWRPQLVVLLELWFIIPSGRDSSFSNPLIKNRLIVEGSLPFEKPIRDGHPSISMCSRAQTSMSSRRDLGFSQQDIRSILRVVGNCPFGKQMREGHFSIFKYSRRHRHTLLLLLLLLWLLIIILSGRLLRLWQLAIVRRLSMSEKHWSGNDTNFAQSWIINSVRYA